MPGRQEVSEQTPARRAERRPTPWEQAAFPKVECPLPLPAQQRYTVRMPYLLEEHGAHLPWKVQESEVTDSPEKTVLPEILEHT